MKNSITDRLAYGLLRFLSHSRNRQNASQISQELEHDYYHHARSQRSIRILRRYADLKQRAILEIGCGTGNLSISLAAQEARRVVGIDIDNNRICAAARKAETEGVSAIAAFQCADFVRDFQPDQPFDIVISENSMEHILNPAQCIRKVFDCLVPGGVMLAKFGPLWLSPWGAHMRGFTPIPWVHLIFPEHIVLRVRSDVYRPDNRVSRYEDVDGNLNRMTVAAFKRIAADAGFRIRALRINPILDDRWYASLNNILNGVPLLRELSSHVLLAVIEKPIAGGHEHPVAS